ncbi:unnamed protein product [Phytophthora fragariaefolia]|uniref:Unnamed protein product n=1 Tax=Phytophthora fragariaefolia TaxID=1490495 RepID=A0A9W6WS65_9STRA|nr:unnamed protein product [Phytophthora fragariaefolia]
MSVEDLSDWPFSLFVVDAVGPLVTTPRGNKFILVFADYFTRWVEAFPVAALDTLTFVQIMVDEVLCRHGVPERLLGDRGTNFISELAKSFYEPLGLKKLFGTAYHPDSKAGGTLRWTSDWNVTHVRQRNSIRLGPVFAACAVCLPNFLPQDFGRLSLIQFIRARSCFASGLGLFKH